MATAHEKDIQQKKLLWSIDQNHMPYTNYHLNENIMPIEINWSDNYKYSMVSLSWHTNLQLKHKVMVVRGKGGKVMGRGLCLTDSVSIFKISSLGSARGKKEE